MAKRLATSGKVKVPKWGVMFHQDCCKIPTRLSLVAPTREWARIWKLEKWGKSKCFHVVRIIGTVSYTVAK